MNLAKQAEADLIFTLEDSIDGFGVALILIDEETNEYNVNAQTTDIGFFVDPQSGVGVAGRQVEISIRISTLTNLGGGVPNKNWKGQYTDTNNNKYNFSVQQLRPDRKIGIYNLLLESFNNGCNN